MNNKYSTMYMNKHLNLKSSLYSTLQTTQPKVTGQLSETDINTSICNDSTNIIRYEMPSKRNPFINYPIEKGKVNINSRATGRGSSEEVIDQTIEEKCQYVKKSQFYSSKPLSKNDEESLNMISCDKVCNSDILDSMSSSVFIFEEKQRYNPHKIGSRNFNNGEIKNAISVSEDKKKPLFENNIRAFNFEDVEGGFSINPIIDDEKKPGSKIFINIIPRNPKNGIEESASEISSSY